MRHRGGVERGVGRQGRVDVERIAQRGGDEVAVRQHHALGSTGGAGGIEQPGEIVVAALRWSRQRRRTAQRPPVVAADTKPWNIRAPTV